MYRREPPLCDDEAGRGAWALFCEASAAEAGDAKRAAELYRRCARACPDFAAAVGLA